MGRPVSFLDRAIAAVAPGVGLGRIRAKAQFDALARRGYDGAAVGRNTAGWRTPSTSADSEVYNGGRRLRDRSRDLVRNNPHAAKALSILAGNIVGVGIMPQPRAGNDRKNKRVKAAFDKWCKTCDAEGQLDFYGLQTLAVRGMAEGGEMLARRRWRKASDGLAIPMQVQLLEPDYLDDFRIGPLANGNKAVGGIEFNKIGQRAAYWLYPEHPGNAFVVAAPNLTSTPVPASEILHLYEKQRTQARGVPWTSPVIRRMRDSDDYDFAEGIRKKIESSAVAFVIGDDPEEEGVAPTVEDQRGNLIEKFVPGLIARLRGGKDVKFNQPATIGGYEEYKRVSARDVATGLRVPYELMTGDLSNVNFSSARVGIVEFRRFCEIMQWQVVVPMFCDPMWAWFCEAAYLAGEIDDPYVPVEWNPPKWQAIEPYKDALADLIVIRTGTRSWPDVTAERGRDPDAVLAEIAAWNKKLDDAGITLDSDPRRTSLKGAIQKDLAPQDSQSADNPSGDAGAAAQN